MTGKNIKKIMTSKAPPLYWLLFTFGFVNGFIVLISGGSVNFWLAKSDISLEIIGLFSVTTLPYSFNFLWSPIIDKFSIPIIGGKLGNRFSWLILLHMLMAIFIYFLSLLRPESNVLHFAILTFMVSLFSSTTDAVLNGWRSEIISHHKQGITTSIYIFGYRLGSVISGSGSIYLSTIIGWQTIYKLYALSSIIFPCLIYCFARNYLFRTIAVNKHPHLGSIKTILNIKYLSLIILLLILYRLPDNIFGAMINAFSLSIGFDEIEIASIGKILGVLGTVIGGFIAGIMIDQIPLIRALYLFGIIHAISHLCFLLLVDSGSNLSLYAIVIGLQSITGGMAMTSYIAYITSLSTGHYSATKYSFFSSSMGFARSLFPGISGYIAANLGWGYFYICVFIASLPSLLVIQYLSKNKHD